MFPPLISKSLLDSGSVPDKWSKRKVINLQVQQMQASWVTEVYSGSFQLQQSVLLFLVQTYIDKMLIVCSFLQLL